jgi:hypothetical protein
MDIATVASEPLFSQFAAGFALCALACGLILVGHVSIRRAADSEKWPAVEGTVLDSAVAADRDGGRQRFQPVVRYRYEVGGERYEGSRIRWAASEGYRKYTRARRVLDKYRSGAAITVHYDPRRPGVAVLKPGHAAVLQPVRLIASTAAVYALFTIGLAIAGY